MSTPTTAVATLPHYHHLHHHLHHNHNHNHDHDHALALAHGHTYSHYPHHLDPLDPLDRLDRLDRHNPLPPQGHLHHHRSTASNYRSTDINSLLSSPTSSVVPTTSNSSSTARPLLPFHQPGTQNHLHSSPAPPPPHPGHYLHHDPVEPSTPTTPRHHIEYNHSSSIIMASATLTATATATSTSTATTMAAAAAAGSAADDAAPSRKRRRSREPDWNTFYRNGLPKEIIVIDDTPEPEANTGRKLTLANINGNYLPAKSAAAPAAAHPSARNANPTTVAARQPTKRRRRDVPAVIPPPAPAPPPPGYHVQYVASHTNTPLQNATTSTASTLSSTDRTNSIHTTAPTSLSSHSQYDEPPAPLKRKRTTRQQAANDAKRRDLDGLGGQLFTYKPPPLPPKKVSDVHVRVVHDQHYNKNSKVDDDDGHYIVVPDAELTDK
ncbi:hypothetical protein E4U54_006491, partial [Claviceps lovelessii]